MPMGMNAGQLALLLEGFTGDFASVRPSMVQLLIDGGGERVLVQGRDIRLHSGRAQFRLDRPVRTPMDLLPDDGDDLPRVDRIVLLSP